MVSFKKLRQMIEVNGNGNIVSKETEVSTFVRLHLACKGVVELHQGEEEKVMIECDENLLEYFSAGNAGRTLYVATEANLKRLNFTKCVVKVFLRQLHLLYVRNDKGDVVCPSELSLSQPLEVKVQSVGNTELNLAVPSLKVLCQGTGFTLVKGRCEKLEVKNQGTGDFDSSHMKAAEVVLRSMATGNMRVHADKTIRISNFGTGYIHYYGNAVVEDVKQYGTGVIKHMSGEA
jgi:hypothetical protein